MVMSEEVMRIRVESAIETEGVKVEEKDWVKIWDAENGEREGVKIVEKDWVEIWGAKTEELEAERVVMGLVGKG